MRSFNVFPAIDLRGGKVVRLKQGDPDRQTVYPDNPAKAARNWIAQGARWLHVVNLSGAFGEGASENQNALQEILAESARANPAVKVQFGGGLRTLEEVSDLLSQGVSRVILGTLAISAPDLLEEAMKRFGNQNLAVAIDARGGRVQVQGWQKETDMSPLNFAKQLKRIGVKTVIYTNIARDGLGHGVDIAMTEKIARESGLQVIASGGVNALEDIREVREAGLSGIVIGRALYEEKFTLKEALKC